MLPILDFSRLIQDDMLTIAAETIDAGTIEPLFTFLSSEDGPKKIGITTTSAFGQRANEIVKELVKIITSKFAITTLDLGHAFMDTEATKTLVAALEKNTSIAELYLNGNNIGTEASETLAATLKVNHSITALDLSHNRMGNEGTKSVAEALKVNHSITKLGLYDNEIGAEWVKALESKLKKNVELLDSWKKITALIAFERANATNKFRHSILNIMGQIGFFGGFPYKREYHTVKEIASAGAEGNVLVGSSSSSNSSSIPSSSSISQSSQ